MCTWKTLAWISSVIPMFSFFASFLLPESPSWLVTSGRKHKCFNSLKKLRGSTCDVQREVNTLVEFSERQNSSTKMTAKQKLRNLCQAAVLKPFLILTTYFFIYQMSGCNPLMFYVVNIFEVSRTWFEREAQLSKSIFEFLIFIYLFLGFWS